MATRVYFPETQAAPVTPPTPTADWEHNNGVTRALLLEVDSSTLTTTAYTPDAADDLTNRDAMHRQYVSESLKAQTLSGNVKAQFQCSETFANDNLFLTIKILVCSSDGSTTRATLLAITRDSTNELATSLTNRNFPSTAVTNYTCVDGDRLVIEVGVGGSISSGTGGTIGHNASLRFGCNASSGDLPEDDSQTGTTYRPWLEFANTIKWLRDADGSSTGSVTTADAASASVIPGVGSSSGTTSVSADGEASAPITRVKTTQLAPSATSGQRYTDFTRIITGIQEGDGASAGTSTVSGAGVALWDSVGASDGSSTASGVGVGYALTEGASVGSSPTSADGLALTAGVASSTGTSTTQADTLSFGQGVAASTGVGTVDGVSGATAGSVANSSGVSTADALSEGPTPADGSSNGAAVVTGIGAFYVSASGSSDGLSLGDARSDAILLTVGTASGTSLVTGIGEDASAPPPASAVLEYSYRGGRGRR